MPNLRFILSFGKMYIITSKGEDLNLRTEPSINSAIIRKLHAGEVIGLYPSVVQKLLMVICGGKLIQQIVPWAGLSKCPIGMNLAHDTFRVGAEAQRDFGFSLLSFEEGVGLELNSVVE